MCAQKVHEFLPMEGCQATAHKDEEVVQGQVVKAVVEEVFCKQAPGRGIYAWVGGPPIEGQLEDEEES